MKKKHYLGLFLLAPVVLFFAGPRPSPNFSVRKPALPEEPRDLDDFLLESESAHSDLIEGVDKKIVWAHPEQREKTPVSIVYLHGFSATRQEVSPLCDVLAARLGANLFYTRLAGHGHEDASALGHATVNEWLQDSIEALEIGKMIGERVIIVATSTGATLSTWLASKPDLMDGVIANVMLSPNYEVADRNARVALWPWGKQILRTAVGKDHSWTPANKLQKKYWSTVYPIEAIVTMMSLVDAVNALDLSAISLPTLVVYSEKDAVISVEKIKEKFPEFGGRKNHIVAIETVEESKSHVLAGDILAPEMTPVIADTISTFLETLGLDAGSDEAVPQAEWTPLSEQ